jgi:hypothetical protein
MQQQKVDIKTLTGSWYAYNKRVFYRLYIAIVPSGSTQKDFFEIARKFLLLITLEFEADPYS